MRMTLSARNTQATIANFRAFDEGLQAEVRGIVTETGEFTKELAQFFAPVDTGFLRDHLDTLYGELGYSFETGWREEDFGAAGLPFYPIFTEFGTQYMPAQPCLFPAYAEAKPRFIRDITDAIRRSAQQARLQ